jgi:multiple sugar transport system substrate-binding protein
MMKKTLKVFLLLIFLMVLTYTVSAGGGSEAKPEKVSEVERVIGELPARLLSNKPYDGTVLDVLVCCPDTAQFVQWEKWGSTEFNELTGIAVNFTYEPWASFQEKIMNEGVAGTGTYDVILYLDSWGPGLTNFMEPLNDYIEADGLDINAWPPAFINGATYGEDQQIYGMPVRGHAQLMFYRDDLLKQVGAEVPTTWQELREVSKKITEETDTYGVVHYYGRGGQGQNFMVWSSYLWSNGGDFFDDNMKPIFNNKAGVEATKAYLELLTVDKSVPPGATGYIEGDARKSIMQGEAAIVINWWWSYANMTDPKQAIPEVVENLKFTAVPSWEGKGSGTYALSMPLGISSYSDAKGASWEFIKSITNNPELQKKIALDPEYPNNVVSLIEVFEDREVNDHWNGIQDAAIIGLKNSDVMPMIVEWAEISSVIEVMMNVLATSDADIQDEMDKAAAEVEKILDRAGYYN